MPVTSLERANPFGVGSRSDSAGKLEQLPDFAPLGKTRAVATTALQSLDSASSTSDMPKLELPLSIDQGVKQIVSNSAVRKAINEALKEINAAFKTTPKSKLAANIRSHMMGLFARNK